MSRRVEREAERQKAQAELDSERSQEERNRLGQFATPASLARAIARIGLSFLGREPVRFLEPAIGTGAFFSALLAEVPRRRLVSAIGVELDERFAGAARRLWASAGLQVVMGDFSGLAPTSPANLLLANPPYVRHHHLGREKKLELRESVARALGCRVSGLAGLYVYFILLAHRWLTENGVAAWLVPSEWMDVNYGRALREYLCTRVHLLRVHRFDVADVQFGDALVSSSVLFFRKAEPGADAVCELTLGDISAPSLRREVRVRDLRGTMKWGRCFRTSRRAAREHAGEQVRLGELVHVKRGIATGANAFFIRPLDEFLAMGIPREFLRPILPSPRYLEGPVIAKRRDGFADLAAPLALLDCHLHEQEVEERHPRLWRYLESPQGQEARKGYLARGRRPWYSQERRPHAPILATYMGRSRKGSAPFRFFWNESDATATNVFLLLIPKGPLADLLRSQPGKAAVVRDFLAGTEPAELMGHGRVYGGGLYKLEPGELGRLDAFRLTRQLDLRPRGSKLTDTEPEARFSLAARRLAT